MKGFQRLSDLDAMRRGSKLANRLFVLATAFFDDGNGFPYPTSVLEEAKINQGIGEIAYFNRGRHILSENALLRDDYERQDALLIEKVKELVQLGKQKVFIDHRVKIAIEAVYN
ncbi:MAG: hypothetical protein M3Q07_22740, partial [Pseudobdellovibrionaceae bacterium]|nr:hypothetical protein [Pseudobdellovibrionaceae bacterium]